MASSLLLAGSVNIAPFCQVQHQSFNPSNLVQKKLKGLTNGMPKEVAVIKTQHDNTPELLWDKKTGMPRVTEEVGQEIFVPITPNTGKTFSFEASKLHDAKEICGLQQEILSKDELVKYNKILNAVTNSDTTTDGFHGKVSQDFSDALHIISPEFTKNLYIQLLHSFKTYGEALGALRNKDDRQITANSIHDYVRRNPDYQEIATGLEKEYKLSVSGIKRERALALFKFHYNHNKYFRALIHNTAAQNANIFAIRSGKKEGTFADAVGHGGLVQGWNMHISSNTLEIDNKVSDSVLKVISHEGCHLSGFEHDDDLTAKARQKIDAPNFTLDEEDKQNMLKLIELSKGSMNECIKIINAESLKNIREKFPTLFKKEAKLYSSKLIHATTATKAPEVAYATSKPTPIIDNQKSNKEEDIEGRIAGEFSFRESDAGNSFLVFNPMKTVIEPSKTYAYNVHSEPEVVPYKLSEKDFENISNFSSMALISMLLSFVSFSTAMSIFDMKNTDKETEEKIRRVEEANRALMQKKMQ